MNTKRQWAPCRDVTVDHVSHTESGALVVSGTLAPKGICPGCGLQSRRRHGWRHRRLQDFPAHGNAVTVELRVCRWRCSGRAEIPAASNFDVPSDCRNYWYRSVFVEWRDYEGTYGQEKVHY